MVASAPIHGTPIASSPTQARPTSTDGGRRGRHARWIVPVAVLTALVWSGIALTGWHLIRSNHVPSVDELLATGPPQSHRDFPASPTEHAVSMRIEELGGEQDCR